MTTTGMRQRRLFFSTLLTLILLLFSIVPFSFAEEIVETSFIGAAVAQFTAVTAAQEITCAAEPTATSITIFNQGTLPDTYYFSLSTEDTNILSWITLGENEVILQPGEQKEILIYVTTPPGVVGTHTYIVTITSLYDSIKEITKTITVQECPNIALHAYVAIQETCPCSTGAYVFELANTGSTFETYDLWLTDINTAYYDLSEYALALAPGEKKEIYAYVRMACFIYGDFAPTMIAQTRGSGYTAEIPLSLHVEQGCYNYNVALGEALIFEEDTILTVTFTPASSTAYTFCQETPAVIPVQIQNPGEIMNEYQFHVQDAETWISPAEPFVRLKGMNKHISSLVVNAAAAAPGLYSFALKADTLRGDLESVMPFTVEIQDCSQEELPSWLKWTLLFLLGLVVLAIIVVGALLYNTHKQWLMILLPLLLLLLLVAWFAYPLVKEKYTETVANGTASSASAPTIPTLFYNWVTALILLALLLLLAFLVWWFKLRSKMKTKKMKNVLLTSSASQRWEKVKPLLKWLWIIFLLLLLLTGLVAGLYFLYQNYKEDTTTEVEITTDTDTKTSMSEKDQKDLDTQELEKSIEQLQQQIAALEEKLVSIAEDAVQQEGLTAEEEQAYQEQIATLETRIAALEQQLKELQNLIATLTLEKQANTETQDIIDTVEEEIKNLEEEKEQLEQEDAKEAEEAVTEDIFVPAVPNDNYKTVLIFDTSLSAQIVENGKTRFQRGIEAAEKYVQEKGVYTIMIVGKNAIIIKRNVDRDQTLKTLVYLRPLDTQSNLGNALYEAAKDLNGHEGRVVLISDLQTTDGTDIYAIHDELEAQGVDIVFINIAQPSSTLVPVSSEESVSLQESPSFVVESQTAESFLIELFKNAVYTLDLSTYFTDPDGDSLTYAVIPGEHLFAEISNSLAMLTPEKDWTGETTIIFTAEDGKGGMVTSPALLVRVASSEEEQLNASETSTIEDKKTEDEKTAGTINNDSQTTETASQDYIPGIILGSIISLILISLIIGAFARKYHDHSQHKEEKEHSEEKEEDQRR